MKKNNKHKSPEKSEIREKEPVRASNIREPGGENSNFPEEYEEQRSMDIRMKPQPYIKPEKSQGV
jgi:hypothetical protein